MGEHLPCKQGVMGSNPIISIKRAERSGWKTGLSGLLEKKEGIRKGTVPEGNSNSPVDCLKETRENPERRTCWSSKEESRVEPHRLAGS